MFISIVLKQPTNLLRNNFPNKKTIENHPVTQQDGFFFIGMPEKYFVTLRFSILNV